MPPSDIESHLYSNELTEVIGRAINEYTKVEGELVFLFQALTKVDVLKAYTILVAIQNARSKAEMFGNLLLHANPQLKTYWDSCSKFLLTLAQFRNAIAHWHPHINLYVNKDRTQTRWSHALAYPVPGRYQPLEPKDISPFLTDCQYICEELASLTGLVKERPSPLPDKFLQRLVRRNQAVLRPPRTAKAPQPQRPPSRPSPLQKGRKPSAKQRRQRAFADAKKKAGGTPA
jgi:hypothetical protein